MPFEPSPPSPPPEPSHASGLAEELRIAAEEIEAYAEAVEAAGREGQLGSSHTSGFLHAIQLPIFVLSADGGILRANASALRLLAWHARDLSGTRLGGFVTPESRHHLRAAFQSIREGREAVRCELVLMVRGGRVPFLLQGSPLRSAAGIGGMVCVLTEMTELRRVERSLRRSAERFRKIFDANRDSMLMIDAATRRILDANEAFCELVGARRSEIRDTSVLQWHPVAQSSQVTERLLLASARGSAETVASTVLAADRSTIPVDYSVYSFSEDERTVLVAAMRDITPNLKHAEERARLKEQVSAVQKMEALGTLAGGVAHDMNNLLATIMSVSELLATGLAVDDPLQSDVVALRMAANMGRDLIKRLLSLTRTGGAPETLRIKERVQDAYGVLRRTVDKKLHLRLAGDSTDPWVTGDSAALTLAIVNLVMNAADAMPDGGTIHIVSRTVGDEVLLEVRDSGVGMPPEVLARALDPYFTTKAAGKGTGLGLPMVFNTAAQCGGRLEIASEVGVGTTASLILPLAEHPVEREPARMTTLPDLGALKVLVVDDEDLVRRSLARLVKSLGHEVTTAASGLQALEIFADADVVLLDVAMPGMDGPDVLRRMRQLAPDVRVVMMTGYNSSGERLASLNAAGYLQKPFDRAEVSRAMVDAMN